MNLVINIDLVYTETNIDAKKPIHKTTSLSNSSFFDVELVKLFDCSLRENTPYLIKLENDVNCVGWIKRLRQYWEREKGLSITHHAKTNSIWVVPMDDAF